MGYGAASGVYGKDSPTKAYPQGTLRRQDAARGVDGGPEHAARNADRPPSNWKLIVCFDMWVRPPAPCADDDVLRIHCGEQLADRSYAFVGVDSTVLRPDRGRSSDPRPDGPCMSRTRSATPDGRRKDFELAALNREMRDALRKHRLGHRSRFSFDPGFTVPVMRVDENVAEKLGRWQERALVRDPSAYPRTLLLYGWAWSWWPRPLCRVLI